MIGDVVWACVYIDSVSSMGVWVVLLVVGVWLVLARVKISLVRPLHQGSP